MVVTNDLMYKMIFKRKSFHFFRDLHTKVEFKNSLNITEREIEKIYDVFKSLKPLDENIKVDIRIVSNDKTTCNRCQEYVILFYSEKKNNYLQNIGFIGEQLDLYLNSLDIGVLWFGIGKTELTEYNGMSFVTMMAIGKCPSDKFRSNMFKSKRKAIEEIWEMQEYLNIANIVRFAPSSCNTQPWITKKEGNCLKVYRYKKPGKRGIMAKNKVVYQNLIDIGIFLLFLDVTLTYEKINHKINLVDDYPENDNELTLSAIIEII